MELEKVCFVLLLLGYSILFRIWKSCQANVSFIYLVNTEYYVLGTMLVTHVTTPEVALKHSWGLLPQSLSASLGL